MRAWVRKVVATSVWDGRGDGREEGATLVADTVKVDLVESEAGCG